MTVRLKARARRDLDTIWAWGSSRWGEERTADFLAGMIDAIEQLRDRPMMGRMRASLAPNLRSILHRGYVLFYVIEDGAPVVVAILHERQNHAALDFADAIEGE